MRPNRFSSRFVFETIILGGMLVALIIPSNLASIAPWMEFPPLLFARAFLWLSALSVLPGLYVLRLVGIQKTLSKTGKLAIGINLSLVLVGLTSLILYSVAGSISLLPWFVLAILLILHLVYGVKSKVYMPTVRLKLSKWDLLLVTAIAASIIMSLSVQVSQRYLLPGDVWVSLNPAVQVLSQRNVYQTFMPTLYPLMFGFILAGLSACSGLPVVNTYVLLFPLTGLNILTFYVLIRNVFDAGKDVAVTGTVLYGFAGGFGWLVQNVIHSGGASFLTVSYQTLDMYFTSHFWNDIMFFHKSLALTLGFAFLVTLEAARRLKEPSKKIATISISALLILFSFYIHMLEPIILAPVGLFLYLFRSRDSQRYLSFGILVSITVLIACVLEVLMSGYYLWLTNYKVDIVLSEVGTGKVLFFLVLLIGLLFPVIASAYGISRYLRKIVGPKNKVIKRVIACALIIAYFVGSYFVITVSSLSFQTYELNPLPWQYYTTRYGFVGLLAIIGVGVIEWREKWFQTASFWCLLVLLIGNTWWTVRITNYLVPMIALFAAFGVKAIWRRASIVTHIRGSELNLKPVSATLIIAILALSFSSIIYGASYYSSTGPCLSDDEVRTLLWVQQNISENTTVLVPKIYNLYKGINTIGDRRIYLNDELPAVIDAASFTNLTHTLSTRNIRYAVSTENEGKNSPVGLLLSHSELVFQSGTIRTHLLPTLSPASSKDYTVAVLDRQLPGFFGDVHGFGWIDDSFVDDWVCSNVEAESDGEILTFQWNFRPGDNREPLAKKKIFSIDTNTYPYLVVRYRNTDETSASAQDNLGQIITLVNEIGYPKGFIGNFYLPVSRDETFQIFTHKLPENCSVANIWIWMRNYKGLNGTVGLHIDYIGFASSESITDPYIDARFLCMALPAVWPMNYSIFSNFNKTGKAPILVSVYDKNPLNHVQEATNTNTFVFLNFTAVFPSWGTGWKDVKRGIISGYLADRKVVIIGLESLYQENMINMAQVIYEEITN